MERDKNQEVSWNIYMIQWGRKFWATTLGIFSATGLWCVYVKVTESCLTLSNPRQSMEFSRPEYWRGLPFPSLGDLPTQGLNPGLPHCRRIPHQLSHLGRPRILEWVAYPFSSSSSQPRNPIGVSCIAGGFLTSWVSTVGNINGLPTPQLAAPCLHCFLPHFGIWNDSKCHM